MVTDQQEKIKTFLSDNRETIGILFFMLCIGIGSFFFGRAYGIQETSVTHPASLSLSDREAQVPPAKTILTDIQKASITPTRESKTGEYVASRSGTKYYPSTGCGAVNRIKPENRVYFASAKDAEIKGYERYSGCK